MIRFWPQINTKQTPWKSGRSQKGEVPCCNCNNPKAAASPAVAYLHLALHASQGDCTSVAVPALLCCVTVGLRVCVDLNLFHSFQGCCVQLQACSSVSAVCRWLQLAPKIPSPRISSCLPDQSLAHC